MKKSDIKTGIAYAIGRGSRSGWAKDQAYEGYVLGPDTRRGYERNSVILSRIGEVTDPVEPQVAIKSYTVEDHTFLIRQPWTTADKVAQADYKKAHPLPTGWVAQSIDNSKIWQEWSSYVVERDEREAAKKVAAAARAVKRTQNEADAERIRQSLTGLGLSVDKWRVDANNRTVKLSFEEVGALILEAHSI
jgi:hypothetical protein